MKNINLFTPINQLGYGIVGLNILKELHNRKLEPTLFPIGNRIEISNDNDKAIINPALQRQEFFSYDAPCIKIWHQFDLANRIGNGDYIAWPIFELDNFSKREIHHLSFADKIVVCSEWARSIVTQTIPDTNCYVVPLGVDRSIFNENQPSVRMEWDNEPRCIFMNCGKWEYRKGHDILIRAFCEAFEPSDNVELRVAADNPFLGPERVKKWQSTYLDNKMGNVGKVRLINRVKSQIDLAKLFQSAFCGVFPSRAEGWNLELLEFMSMGKECIATNYSAHTEFANTDNCRLIDIDETEIAVEPPFFDGKVGSWASLGHSQFTKLVEHMQEVYDLWIKEPNYRNSRGIKTAKDFTWTNSVNNLLKAIE